MTNEDIKLARIYIDNYCEQRHSEIGCKRCCAEIVDCHLRTLREALEKAEKYRWHDLRKDPEDLPEEGEKVLAYVKVDDNYLPTLTFRQSYRGRKEWNCVNEIVIWREIDPFEGVE